MNWDKVCGQEKLKEKLKETIKSKRISHAQLFSGKNGWGALALARAYAAEILAFEKGEGARKKVNDLQHPDIHYTFPVTSTDKIKQPTSNHFFKEWREFMLQNPYGSLYDWLEYKEVEKKQGIINVHEASDIAKFISLNSYEGGHKIVLIWLAEMMNEATANKLLKAIEEPPAKTLFFLVSEREDFLLETIRSRCQLVKLNRLADEEIIDFLIKNYEVDFELASQIAKSANGDLNLALKNTQSTNEEFERYFIHWVRNAFRAAKTPVILKELIEWSNDLSNWPREKQRQFLVYCSEIFRQALLQNYQANSLVFMKLKLEGFKWENFAPYIHGANIEAILEEINKAVYHIERNGNSKIILLDLSILLTRFLHRKVN